MEGNLETVRRMFQLLEEQDFEPMIAVLAPEFEFDVSTNVFNPAVYRGREGFSQWIEEASEVWLPPDITVRSVEELEDGRVFASVVVAQTGRLSGIQVSRQMWQLWTFRDGLVAHLELFNDEEPARRAAGL